jgi:hypothetical protein
MMSVVERLGWWDLVRARVKSAFFRMLAERKQQSDQTRGWFEAIENAHKDRRLDPGRR